MGLSRLVLSAQSEVNEYQSVTVAYVATTPVTMGDLTSHLTGPG